MRSHQETCREGKLQFVYILFSMFRLIIAIIELSYYRNPSHTIQLTLSCSVDIILRHEAVEKAKPGDRCLFTGTLVVVPDIAQLSASGQFDSSMQPIDL